MQIVIIYVFEFYATYPLNLENLRMLRLMSFLALLLGLLLLPQLLFIILDKFFILPGPSAWLITMGLSDSGRLLKSLFVLSLSLLFELLNSLGICKSIAVVSLVFSVESGVGTLRSILKGLASLGVGA